MRLHVDMKSSTKAPRQFYKPFVTETAVLTSFLLITITLIAIIELGCKRIPNHPGIGILRQSARSTSLKSIKENALLLRQNAVEYSTLILSTPFQLPISTKIGTDIGKTPSPALTSPTASFSSASLVVVLTSTPVNPGLSLGDGNTPSPPPLTTTTTSNVPIPMGTHATTRGYLWIGDGQPPTLFTTIPDTGGSSEGLINPSLYVPLPSPTPSSGSPGPNAQTTSGYLLLGGGYASPQPPTATDNVVSGDALITPSVFPPITSPASSISDALPSFEISPELNTLGVSKSASSLQTDIKPITSTNKAVLHSSRTYSTSAPGGALPPTLVLADGSISTQYSKGIAVNFKGSPLPILTTTAGQTFVVTPILTIIGSQTLTETPILTVISGHTYATLIGPPSTKTGSGTNGNQAVTTQSAVFPTSTFVNSTGTYLSWSNSGITLYPQITYEEYIYVAFLPLILVVIYSIPLQILDRTIRKMEPFYQLHGTDGGLGRDSLCLDYCSWLLIGVPFKAAYRGHMFPLWSSLISLSILVLAPLASEAFFVSLGTGCYANTTELCHASWGIYPILARIMQGILSLVAALLFLLIIFSFRRNSGVYSEPLSIAGLGVLISKSPLLDWLLAIDSKVNNKELMKSLERKRFALSWFVADDGRKSYGIIPLDAGSEDGSTLSERKPRKNRLASIKAMLNGLISTQKTSGGQTIITREPTGSSAAKEKYLYIIAFPIFGGLLAMISYYHWTGANAAGQSTAFETYMDSRGFGVRFMMAVVGVAVKLLWSWIDTDIRNNASYNRLLLGSSSPQDSILLPVWLSPLSAVMPSFCRGHYLTAIVCAIALPVDFLPLFLSNIPFSFGTTKLAYNICNFLSMAILILMTVTVAILILRRSSGIGSLPRTPDTLASIAIYLAGEGDGSMLDSFAGLSVLGKEERDTTVRKMGARYSIGFVDDARVELRIADSLRVQRI